jgi:pyruvate dehydrogenase E1 component
MIPFYIFYSMFGFQRVGDSIWAGADLRAKGFLIGATAGRTTLNGEGLQHQDGNSLLYAMAYPTVRAYDPAFHYEMAVIIFDGLKKLYVDGETAIYYLMAGNESYVMPEMPAGIEEQIVKGMYKFRTVEAAKAKHRVQLFGSGAIMNCVLEGQKILAEHFGISSDVWSVTSYTELRREAQEVRRLNMLNPTQKPKLSFVEQQMAGHAGPIIAASDYVRAVSEQVAPWMPAPFLALGTDGMGRSETREALRRHFEVDGQFVAVAALWKLAQEKQLEMKEVEKAIKKLGIDPAKISPLYA